MAQNPSQQTQGDRDEDKAQKASSERSEDQRGQQAQSEKSPSSSRSNMRDARRHYMAGFVRGYYSGVADGLDDYLIIVGQPADQGDQQQGASRQQADEQRLRGRLRNDARNRARGESRGRTQGRRDEQSSSTQQQISGEIVSVKRVRLQNDRQQHLLLLMESDQGTRRIVDAGPASQLTDLSIEPGDQITAQGAMRRTRDGVPVLNARWVESSGQRVAIQGQVTQSSQRSRR